MTTGRYATHCFKWAPARATCCSYDSMATTVCWIPGQDRCLCLAERATPRRIHTCRMGERNKRGRRQHNRQQETNKGRRSDGMEPTGSYLERSTIGQQQQGKSMHGGLAAVASY